MSESDAGMGEVFSGQAARREPIVAPFEDAWRAGKYPSIDDFLAGDRGGRFDHGCR